MTKYRDEHNDQWSGGPRRPGRSEHGPHGMGHGRGGWGAGAWGMGDFGPGGRGAPRGFPWARRMRRGDIRGVLLVALLDGPAHGYEIITRLEQQSAGMWRPSAGSVYPTLQLLEEEGKVTGKDEGGKRVYELTDDGRREAEEAGRRRPWGDFGPSDAHKALFGSLGQLALAMRQVAMAGDPAQVEAAAAIVTEARQKLYRLLAGEPQ